MITQTEFAGVKIGNKVEGYYSECLSACLEERVTPSIAMSPAYIQQVADIVLARAQLHLSRIPGTAEEFLKAFNILAHARAEVTGYVQRSWL